MSTIFIGDIGTEILLNTGVSLASATVKKMRVKKPSGTIVEWTATVVNTTYLKYITLAGDLNEAGTYRIQAKVTLPSWSGYGDIAEFIVSTAL